MNGSAVQEVVVTGLGPILPRCDERATFWRQVRDGESQLSLEPDPSIPGERIVMGKIRDFDPRRYLPGIPERYYEHFVPAQLLYLSSVARACEDAGMAREALRSDRVGLFDGTSRDNVAFWHDERGARATRHDLAVGMAGMAVGLAAAIFGIRGPTYTFTSTCASGVVAMGHALRELQSGDIDVALATGHDSLLPAAVVQTYREVGLLQGEAGDPRKALRPFGGSSRNVFGEGAVTLVLETRAHAEARGAHILATLAAYRYGNGGEHPTHVDATGQVAARLIEQALERAGVSREEVGFVLGHGNGVPASDRSEIAYMRRVFGARAREVPLLSTKPIYGHTLGASGVINAAVAALMLHEQFIVPTINVEESLVAPDVCHQANRGAPRRCDAGVVVCFGIGGQHAVLVLRRRLAAG
jgi:3-oxoacyl-[acyl-carrier-protein] synthase II